MKKKFVTLLALLVAAFSAQAEESDVCAATGCLNTQQVMEERPVGLALTYDPAWIDAETCTLKLNGETLASGNRAGKVDWSPEPGLHSVTLEGGGKTLTVTCIIGTGTDAVAAKGPLDVACVGAFVTDPSAKTVAYDPAWIDAATCSVRVNGEVVVANTAQAGVIDWLPEEDGIYSFELVGGEKSLANTLIVGTGVAESESVGSVDTRTGQRFANLGEVKTLAYSPQWDQAAYSSVKENGRQIVRSAAEGTLGWTAAECGRYKLVHETEKGVLQAEFTVLGEDVMLHDGILSADEIWGADRVHLVTANVTVPAGVTLMIEPGAVVKFMAGTQLIVETGAIGVCAGAIFTHVADDTVGGDTLMDGSETRPVCAAYGIVGMVEDDDKTQYRYQEPVKLSGTITADTTWRASGVYRVTGNLTVASGATLTIQPGAIVKFDDGVSLTVSSGATLSAVGTRAMPIVFTSVKDDEYAGDTNGDGDTTLPLPGDWARINAGGTITMNYCRIRYCNKDDDRGAIQGTGGTVTFDNGIIEASVYECVRMNSGRFESHNSVFRDASMGFGYFGGSGTYIYNGVVADCTVACRAGNKHFYNTVFYRCKTFLESTSSSCKNCIFYNPEGYGAGTATQVGQNSNKWGDPQFVDPDNGDFRVAETSPCLDAGDTASAPSRDCYGQPRVGAAADVGIYEIMPRYVASDTDLRVLSIRVAEAAVVGDTLKVEWQVSNNGTAPVYETWRDKVELVSARGEKILLGERLMKSGLAAGGSRTCAGEWLVPVVAEGTYTVQVTVNYARDIFEGALTENNVATANLRVSVPSAAATDGAESVLAAKGEGAWHFTLAADSTDRLLTIQAADGVRALFGASGVPTESYNIGAVSSIDGKICFLVPEGVQDVYVKLLNESDGEVACSARFSTAKTQILAVSPLTVPHDGKVTVQVEGAGLDRVKGVALRAADATLVPCAAWRADSSGRLALSADGTTLTQGAFYQLALTDEKGETCVSEQKLSVTQEPAKPEVWAKMNVPATVRDGREYLCTIEYGNKGNADAIAPILRVSVSGKSRVKRVDGDELSSDLLLVGVGGSGDAGALLPGETRKITFTYVAGSSDRVTLQIHEDAAIAAAAARIAARGVDASDYFVAAELADRIAAGEPCGVIYGYVRDADGYPVSGSLLSLTNGAETVQVVTDTRGHYVSEPVAAEDERRDLTVENVAADAYVEVIGSVDEPCVTAVDCASGATFAGERGSDGCYRFRGIPDGVYRVMAQEGEQVADGVIVVSELSFYPLQLTLSEPGRIQGTFTGDGTETEPAVLLVGKGFRRIADVSADGAFVFAGLPAGTYAVGYAGETFADYSVTNELVVVGGETAFCEIVKTNNVVGAASASAALALSGSLLCTVNAVLATATGPVTKDNIEEYMRLLATRAPSFPPSDRNCSHNKRRYQSAMKMYRYVNSTLIRASYVKLELEQVEHELQMQWWKAAELLLGAGLTHALAVVKISKEVRLAATLVPVTLDAAGSAVDILLGEVHGKLDAVVSPAAVFVDLTSSRTALIEFVRTLDLELLERQIAELGRKSYSLSNKLQWAKDDLALIGKLGKLMDCLGTFVGVLQCFKLGMDRTRLLNERDKLQAELGVLLDYINRDISSVLQSPDYPLCCPKEKTPQMPPPVQTNDVPKVMSIDPNEVAGPIGLGDPNTERFVRPGEWMTYTVYFENASNATAGAQEVFVTNPLSEWLDWTTFEMGEVAFAGQIDTGLSGLQVGESEIDFTGTVYRVRSSVTIDKQTGQVDWYLRIVDPNTATGWPEDPYAGFLQPNDETHCGEGHLTYRVKIREDAPRNVRIENAASIVFDYNEAIPTDPSWWNTVGWPLTVGEAACDEAFEWATGGAGEWTAVSDETSPDGKDQAVLRSVGNNASGWLSTTVTGAGNLSFVWRGGWSARTTRVQFFVDGEAAALLSGTNGWETVNVAVYGAGEHELTWRFATGRSGATEDDFLALDEVTWTASEPQALPTLAEALNPLLKWKTDGDVPWQGVRRNSQAEARESWAAIDGLGDDEYAGLETRVYGTGVLRFDWAVSSEEGYDELIVSVDGQMRQRISGDVVWHSKELKIDGLGWHTIRWEYVKDGLDEEDLVGDNRAMLDNVVWTSDDEPPKNTEGTPVPVPYDVIDASYKAYLDGADGDYEAAALSHGKNGVAIWESYVAGLDPDNEKSTFTAKIELVNGEAKVTWKPDLNEDGTKDVRKYTTYGCEDLGGKWDDLELLSTEQKAKCRFFKVTVEMP